MVDQDKNGERGEASCPHAICFPITCGYHTSEVAIGEKGNVEEDYAGEPGVQAPLQKFLDQRLDDDFSRMPIVKGKEYAWIVCWLVLGVNVDLDKEVEANGECGHDYLVKCIVKVLDVG